MKPGIVFNAGLLRLIVLAGFNAANDGESG